MSDIQTQIVYAKLVVAALEASVMSGHRGEAIKDPLVRAAVQKLMDGLGVMEELGYSVLPSQQPDTHIPNDTTSFGATLAANMTFSTYDDAITHIKAYGRQTGAFFVVRSSRGMDGSFPRGGIATLRCNHFRETTDGSETPGSSEKKRRKIKYPRVTRSSCPAFIKLAYRCGETMPVRIARISLDHIGHEPVPVVAMPNVQEDAIAGLVCELVNSGVHTKMAIDMVAKARGIRVSDENKIYNYVYRERRRRQHMMLEGSNGEGKSSEGLGSNEELGHGEKLDHDEEVEFNVEHVFNGEHGCAKEHECSADHGFGEDQEFSEEGALV
ncbi:hypothetical protein EV174_005876 [Coemansia sp. RSA 2320]|nr:hypothetical protein EV174_005876 [Coemansia sp. RSA 2320]